MSDSCPYQLGFRRSFTCKCEPLCVVCGYGRHASIHSMPKQWPKAHAYQDTIPVNSPFGPQDDVHPGHCDCLRCRQPQSGNEP